MMASRYGMCPNIGNCSIANSRQQIPMSGDENATCPECGRLLIASAAPREGAGSRTPLIAGVAALILLICAAGAYFVFGGAPHERSAEVAVAAAPAARLAAAEVPVQAPPTPAAAAPAAAAPAPAAPTPVAAPPPAAPVPVAAPLAAPQPAPPAEPEAPVILRLSGSNTIGSKLGPLLVERFLVAEGYTIASRQSPKTNETVITATRNGKRVAITVAAHGSSTAFADLSAGKADVGMASRAINAKEIGALKALGDMTSPSNEHVLALDGLAVVVNRTNPLSSLSVAQIRDLFSGAVADWGQIGGRPGAVKLFARDQHSGTFDTFQSLVLGKAKLDEKAQRFEDSRELANAVAAEPNGIGFIGLPYIGPTKAVAVVDKEADPLLPTVFTVSTEDYPLSRRLFFYVSTESSNPVVLNFIEFALSPAGQAAAAESGFVPLTIEAQAVSPPGAAVSKDYRDLAAKGRRLSVNFRFRSGASTLDNKAIRDMDRLVDFLMRLKPEERGGVVLAGFTDSQGPRAGNVALSQQRAQIVADELRRRGVTTQSVLGFGPEMPVANNETDDGREKNRRVEVWLAAPRS